MTGPPDISMIHPSIYKEIKIKTNMNRPELEMFIENKIKHKKKQRY